MVTRETTRGKTYESSVKHVTDPESEESKISHDRGSADKDPDD